MLPVIPHHPENFTRNIAHCLQCGDFDARSGWCKGGIHHAAHCNAGYCPAGRFGCKQKPANWPTDQLPPPPPPAADPAPRKPGECCGG